MKKEKVLQTLEDYKNFKEEIIKISVKLNELDSKKYSSIDDVESFEIEQQKGEDYLCASSEEYHIGCGDYERDYIEFPLRYMWEDFEKDVLKNKEDREQLENEKAVKKAEVKRIAKEEREAKQLEDLLEKIDNNDAIKKAVINKLNLK